MRKPLLALAVSAFGIGTSEFIIMGLLPDLARSFQVSIPKTGILVSGYALSVTLGSPLVALALARMDRKRALLILMGMFIAGNALCALAPNLFAASFCPHSHRALPRRVLRHRKHCGLHLVPSSERAQAITLMFSGLTLANVLGVPAGTALGQAFGWRYAFWALVPIGLIAGSGLFRLVPPQAAEEMHLKHELRAVLRPQVQLVLAMSTLSSVALFCVFTYIAPILEQVTHLSPSAVTGSGGLWGGHYPGQFVRRPAGGLETDAGSHHGICAVGCYLPDHAFSRAQGGPGGGHCICLGLRSLRRRLAPAGAHRGAGKRGSESSFNAESGGIQSGQRVRCEPGRHHAHRGGSYRYLSLGSAAVASVALLVAYCVSIARNEKTQRERS